MGVETILSNRTDLDLNADIAVLNRKKVSTSTGGVTTLSDYYGVDRYNGVPVSGPLSFDDFRGTSMHTASFIPAVRRNLNTTYAGGNNTGSADGPDTGGDRQAYAIGFGTSDSNFRHPEDGTTDLSGAAFGSIDYDTGLFPYSESSKLLGLWVYFQNHGDGDLADVTNLVLQWDGGSSTSNNTSFTALHLKVDNGSGGTDIIGVFYRSQATIANTNIPNVSGSNKRLWAWLDPDNTKFDTTGGALGTHPSAVLTAFLTARTNNRRVYIAFT